MAADDTVPAASQAGPEAVPPRCREASPRPGMTRRTFVRLVGAGAIVASSGGVLQGLTPAPAAAAAGPVVVVVAHTDDDLLFLSPDILHAVQANRPVLIVYTTAGEAGEGSDYWLSLEEGIRSTYAQMAGVANSWSTLPTGVPGRSFLRQGLDGGSVQVAFLHIPDGLIDGTGTATYGYDSIIKLWDGRIAYTGLVDGSDTYSRQDLISLLAALLADFKPTQVLTQTWPGAYTETGDHSDHWATANFALAASQANAGPNSITGYYAYITGDWDQNVFGADLDAKTAAFSNFAGYDHNISSPDQLYAPDTYGRWLGRQYISATG